MVKCTEFLRGYSKQMLNENDQSYSRGPDHLAYCPLNCLIARDVMVAMLVAKNNSLSLRWELNFIFMQILRNKIVLF